MVRHLLRRFLLTLPTLWLVLTVVTMLWIAPSGMSSFRMVGESR
jgi:ABC-type microcin C transport system permease subunit YejB